MCSPTVATSLANCSAIFLMLGSSGAIPGGGPSGSPGGGPGGRGADPCGGPGAIEQTENDSYQSKIQQQSHTHTHTHITRR